MKHNGLGEEQVKALWQKSLESGMPRRKFLMLLAGGGAAAVLSACTPIAAPPTPPPAPPAQPPTPPTRPIYEPIPEQFFIPLGTNAEMRFEIMAGRGYSMPNSMFFVRSHTSAPFIDAKTWKLSVQGDGVSRVLELTYDDLLKMPARTVTRYVECAGNGRSFYASLLNKPAQGGQWRLGAYGIAEWTGVALSEILNLAGIKRSAVDVMPTGLDSQAIERPMPVDKAMEDDTIVAYLMNGDILPVDHGFPARVVAPAWVGINSIKWLRKLTVSEKPIFVEKNTNSYVLIGPDYAPQPPAKGPILTSQVLKSACCLPWPAGLKPGMQKITGYAWSPFGKVSRVDVSIDGGNTFQAASLTGPNFEKAGSRWEFNFDARPGQTSLTPRITDDKGNTQWEVLQQKWNEQGYIFGATVPHPVTVTT